MTVLAAAFVLLPRLPALSWEGREHARIRSDVELFAGMPNGETKDRLEVEINRRTRALLDARAERSPADDAWMLGLRWAGAGWVLLVASTAVTGTGAWVPHVVLALDVGGIVAGALGALLLALTAVLILVRALTRGWNRLRSPAVPDYQI